jgi:hypothetical protein
MGDEPETSAQVRRRVIRVELISPKTSFKLKRWK